jgi:hypothetical protein
VKTVSDDEKSDAMQSSANTAGNSFAQTGIDRVK